MWIGPDPVRSDRASGRWPRPGFGDHVFHVGGPPRGCGPQVGGLGGRAAHVTRVQPGGETRRGAANGLAKDHGLEAVVRRKREGAMCIENLEAHRAENGLLRMEVEHRVRSGRCHIFLGSERSVPRENEEPSFHSRWRPSDPLSGIPSEPMAGTGRATSAHVDPTCTATPRTNGAVADLGRSRGTPRPRTLANGAPSQPPPLTWEYLRGQGRHSKATEGWAAPALKIT